MSEHVEGAGEVAPTPLEDILDRSKPADGASTGGQPEATPPPALAAETGEQPAAPSDGPLRDEHGRFAPKAGEVTAAPPAAASDPQHVPFAALKDERTKRQTSEQQVSDLQKQLEEIKRAPVTPTPPPQPIRVPSPVEDPEGYVRYQDDRQFNDRLNISEMMAREKFPDVDAKLEIFETAAKADPALGMKLRQQVHPWDWMYQQAKRIEAMAEIGDDPAAYRAKVETELRAKIAAEGTAVSSPTAQTTPLPTSLASARSVGERTSDTPSGPTPLDAIVRFKG